MEWTREWLAEQGFVGFVQFRDIAGAPVPRAPGIYVVLRSNASRPRFLEISPAGRFKGLDPSVTQGELNAAWVEQSAVMYIGKATNLRQRLSQYRRFGEGKPVGHRGGRYLWHLADAWDCQVGWMETPGQAPRLVEHALIREFASAYGKRPFANRVD